jgi:pyruvate/2-oxoglutarate dehydrogenase complex dihydrolipoamide dehydrogenase (E3) component
LHEVVVVGGGPAGVTAALRARELGAGVALVERGELGGTCTNDGCVPTRVLAHAARLVRDAEQRETSSSGPRSGSPGAADCYSLPASALSSRLTLRAALLGWMTPFVAALS